MRHIQQLTWPDTFGQRFVLALVANLVLVFAVSVLFGLTLGPGILGLTLVLFLAAVVLAALSAAIARPGDSFWKPFFRS